MKKFLKLLPLVFLVGLTTGCNDYDYIPPDDGDIDNPSKPDTDNPSKPDTDNPSKPDTDKPSKPDTDKPSKPDTDKPSKPDTDNPSKPDIDIPGGSDTDIPGGSDTDIPDISYPDVPHTDGDKEKYHITNDFEIKYFLDEKFTSEIKASDLNFIAPEKSIYVKCVVNTTNLDDEDYMFSYVIDIDNITGFSIKTAKGGDSPVTIKDKQSIFGDEGILVEDISFLQRATTKNKTTNFTFLISKKGNSGETKQDMSCVLKVLRKINENKTESLTQYNSELHFSENSIKSVVPTPTFQAEKNSIIVTLNENMSALSKENVDVYVGYDGDKNNNIRCIQKGEDTYVIPDINNHKSVKLTIRTSIATEIDYKKVFNLAKLNTPKLAYKDMSISWNAIEHATTYGLEYSKNNSDFKYFDTTFSELECPLKSIVNDAGTYSFRLEAYSKQDINNDYNGIVYFVSLKSDVLSIRKLEAPIIRRTTGSRKLEWNHVLYADKYEVYVNGKLSLTTENNYFEINSDYDGKRIEVKSISSNPNVIASDLSEKFMVEQA